LIREFDRDVYSFSFSLDLMKDGHDLNEYWKT
jgi:hypothetical protein